MHTNLQFFDLDPVRHQQTNTQAAVQVKPFQRR